MPKLVCKCNYVIGLSDIPSPHQFLMISDTDYDKINKRLDRATLYQMMTLVVKCPNCGRLHVFWEGVDTPQSIYNEDDPGNSFHP
jgi:hypothetical protein